MDSRSVSSLPWSSTSRHACLTITKPEPRDENIGLLADIRTVFGNRNQVSSVELVSAIDSMRGQYRGTPIRTTKNLATILRRFETYPKRMRLGRDENVRGYERSDFRDAWERYLS